MYDVVFVVPSQKAALYEDFHGTLLLATILKQKGLSVHIHRFYEVDTQSGFAAFADQTAEMILDSHPKIVSFYCRCDCYLADLMIAKKLKEARPDLYIVFGGPQADASAVDTLSEIPWVDFCCRGEGESTVYPLFFALLSNTEYTEVEGLTYRDSSGQIVQNDTPALVEDLDALPYIDYSFISQDAIDYSLKHNKAATVEVGRGCPFNCAYCSSSLFWKRKFRLKSAQRIVSEMTEMYNRSGIRKFVFQHDLFTVNKKKVLEFTNALENSDIAFSWACSCRADTLDQETIDAMAKTGLRSVYLGVESGSERMQKSMNKNLKMQDVIDVVAALRKHNMKITASFIYALPEETQEDLEKTLQLAYRLHQMGVSSLQFHLCVIFPGTEYYRRYADKITLSSTQSNIVGDFGFRENQDFIQAHQKMFSYCYEYQSELRSKFSRLSDYAVHVLWLYGKLVQFMPDSFKNKPMTELALEVMDLYEEAPTAKNAYEIGIDYAMRYLSGNEQKKATIAFAYLCDYIKNEHNPNFIADFKTYGMDIAGVVNGKALADIDDRESFVYFKKENGRIVVHVKTV